MRITSRICVIYSIKSHKSPMQHGPIVIPLSGPLETKVWPPLDDEALRKLRRLALLHRLCGFAFGLAFLSIFGGLIGGVWTGATIYPWMTGIGMSLVLIMILMSFFVYPFLRCPRCKQRFFLPSSGLEKYFVRIDITQNACLHCKLPLRQKTDP